MTPVARANSPLTAATKLDVPKHSHLLPAPAPLPPGLLQVGEMRPQTPRVFLLKAAQLPTQLRAPSSPEHLPRPLKADPHLSVEEIATRPKFALSVLEEGLDGDGPPPQIKAQGEAPSLPASTCH